MQPRPAGGEGTRDIDPPLQRSVLAGDVEVELDDTARMLGLRSDTFEPGSGETGERNVLHFLALAHRPCLEVLLPIFVREAGDDDTLGLDRLIVERTGLLVEIADACELGLEAPLGELDVVGVEVVADTHAIGAGSGNQG